MSGYSLEVQADGRFPNLSPWIASLCRTSTVAIFLCYSIWFSLDLRHFTKYFDQGVGMLSFMNQCKMSLCCFFLLIFCSSYQAVILSYTNLQRKSNLCFPSKLLSLFAYQSSQYDTYCHCWDFFFKAIYAKCASAS